MSINIAGIVKNSFVDYPGKIAFVIFTRGCNMNCYFCHNRDLINSKSETLYSEDEIYNEIDKRKKLLDAIVISGGEPLVQKDLSNFIDKLRQLNLFIKLDTNGLLPEKLSKIINKLDYVAMDIKSTFEKYVPIIQINMDTNEIERKIKKSIDIIKKSGKAHEFRTTLIPEITLSDFKEMNSYIGDSPYYIQKYNPNEIREEKIRVIHGIENEIKNLNLPNVKFRGFDALN